MYINLDASLWHTHTHTHTLYGEEKKRKISFKCSDASSLAFSCCYGDAQLISSLPDNFIHLVPARCQSDTAEGCMWVFLEAIDETVRDKMRYVHHLSISLCLLLVYPLSFLPSSLSVLDHFMFNIPCSFFITPPTHINTLHMNT